MLKARILADDWAGAERMRNGRSSSAPQRRVADRPLRGAAWHCSCSAGTWRRACSRTGCGHDEGFPQDVGDALAFIAAHDTVGYIEAIEDGARSRSRRVTNTSKTCRSRTPSSCCRRLPAAGTWRPSSARRCCRQRINRSNSETTKVLRLSAKRLTVGRTNACGAAEAPPHADHSNGPPGTLEECAGSARARSPRSGVPKPD